MQRTVIGVLTYRRKRTIDEPAYFRQFSKEGQKLSSEVYSSPRTISSTATLIDQERLNEAICPDG